MMCQIRAAQSKEELYREYIKSINIIKVHFHFFLLSIKLEGRTPLMLSLLHYFLLFQ